MRTKFSRNEVAVDFNFNSLSHIQQELGIIHEISRNKARRIYSYYGYVMTGVNKLQFARLLRGSCQTNGKLSSFHQG